MFIKLSDIIPDEYTIKYIVAREQNDELFKCDTIWERQDVFRKYYKEVEPLILDYCERARKGLYNPHAFDWERIFTPIEHYAWQVIRCMGMPLYPQYPVLNYILDFGNPLLKIGVELDGKEFHDSARDRIRDQEIYEKTGWKIFRISGSEANKKVEEFPNRYPSQYDDPGELMDYLNTTLEGIMDAIWEVYFTKRDEWDEETDTYNRRCRRSLEDHRLANFDL